VIQRFHKPVYQYQTYSGSATQRDNKARNQTIDVGFDFMMIDPLGNIFGREL
jgi:hypothetical protein